MSRRSFAGYTYAQRLRSGFYGELYRASTAGDHEARLLEVDADLSKMDGFSATLTTHGTQLAGLEHPNIVATRSVGRAPDGRLIVVIDSVAGQATVEDLLRAVAPQGLPQNIAAGIGKQLLQGLAAAHRAGVVHGAVHPRSVVIDSQGVVKLGDFAVGRALAVAISKETTSPLRDSLSGYLAPEVMRGKLATKASDVYAAAAVAYVMLTGTLPPGTVGISAGFERMIQRALDPSLVRRYPDAIDFLENFAEALEDDLWPQASAEEIAAHARGTAVAAPVPPPRKSSDVSLDEATEDILSSLGLEPGASAPAPPRSVPVAVSAAGKGDRSRPSGLAGHDPPTDVDSRPAGHMVERDPISELIALSGDRPVSDGVRVLEPDKPLPPGMTRPASAPDLKPSPTQAEHAALAAIDALDFELGEPTATAATAASIGVPPLPAPPVPRPAAAPAAKPEPESRPSAPETPPSAPETPPSAPETSPAAPEVAPGATPEATPEAAPEAAPVPRPASPEPEVRPRVAAAPDIADYDPLVEVSLKKGGGVGRAFWVLFWLLIAAGGVAVLLWVVDHQSKLKEQADKDRERQQAQNEAALAQFRSSQPKGGQVTIDSKPDKAAVWMLLGRTPLETNPVSTAMLHELRVEFDGYAPQDVRVEGGQWTGSEEMKQAEVKVTLEPEKSGQSVPAAPPKPPDSAMAGLRQGQGRIRVESEPSGAQVWLLVGFTPNVTVDGYAAVDYEFKVRKDGYLPGYITISAKDWDAGDRPGDQQGDQDANQISRSVELKRAGKR